MNENNKIIEEHGHEIEEEFSGEISQEIEDTQTSMKNKKIKKHQEALRLVKEAKVMVKEAEEQTEACKLLLVGDLKEYEHAKESLNRGGLDVCESLLKKLGYVSKVDTGMGVEKVIVFEPKEELAPIVLKNVSSGKFTGFIYSLIGGGVTAVGLIYLATEKLGITLDITKIPSVESMQSIASWFSTALGLGSNVAIGVGIVTLASLLVMALIYAIRVSLQGSKNLHFAIKQLVEAELYTEEKGNCKTEMDKVDAHMKETVTLLKMYEVLFNEQKGKLERILHIEGSKSKSSDYHEKSFTEIHETKELMRTIKDFIATPMSEEGKLSDKSVNFLQGAKVQMDKILERLY